MLLHSVSYLFTFDGRLNYSEKRPNSTFNL
nr:MAG TPA: hypothetical protein [Caudoviricetes sp.]